MLKSKTPVESKRGRCCVLNKLVLVSNWILVCVFKCAGAVYRIRPCSALSFQA